MKLKKACLLFMAAFIWGTAFVAQSVGMDYVGPFTFNGIRSLIGSGSLFIFICVKRLYARKGDRAAEKKKTDKVQMEKRIGYDSKTLWIGGLCCGIALTVASTLQQIGIQYTTAGKAGFVTALYIIFVPVFGIFLKKKAGLKIWMSVFVAAVGLYMLCMKESLVLQKGDFLVFLCAAAFAIHILIIDYFSPKVDGVKLSCIQFLVCGVVCLVCMLLFEEVNATAVIDAAVPLLYAGVFSCGIAYTLQIIGQRGMNPTVSSLILSLESVVSVISGFLILHQGLSARECVGCILMFAAIVMAQIPEKIKDYTCE